MIGEPLDPLGFLFSPERAARLISASSEAVEAYLRCRGRLVKIGDERDPLRALDEAMVALADVSLTTHVAAVVPRST